MTVLIALLVVSGVTNIGSGRSCASAQQDGVSEGQYAAAVETEVRAVKDACREIRPEYAPKLTYIVCGKVSHAPSLSHSISGDESS